MPYPINVLRNMALDGVKMRANQTYIFDPLVLVIDADTKMTGTMKEATEQLRSTLAFGEGPPRFHTFDDERTVFVIPAFAHAKNELMRLEVLDKHDLREYLMKGEAEIMHATSFPISYLGSLDMWRWTFATEPYAVRYTHRWEPYYIARMGLNFPYFDERFVDRGLNKAQQQFSVACRAFQEAMISSGEATDTSRYWCWADDFSKWVRTNRNDLTFPIADKDAYNAAVEEWVMAEEHTLASYDNRSRAVDTLEEQDDLSYGDMTGFAKDPVSGGDVVFTFATFVRLRLYPTPEIVLVHIS